MSAFVSTKQQNMGFHLRYVLVCSDVLCILILNVGQGLYSFEIGSVYTVEVGHSLAQKKEVMTARSLEHTNPTPDGFTGL